MIAGEVIIDDRLFPGDQELSGIDNIYLRALAMGIPREEVAARQDEIVRFGKDDDKRSSRNRWTGAGMLDYRRVRR